MLRGLAPAVLLAVSGTCGATALSLQLGAIEHALFEIRDLVLELAPDGAQASLSIGRTRFAGRSLPSGGRVDCPRFGLAEGELRCEGGHLAVPDLGERLRLDLNLDFNTGQGRVVLRSPRGEQVVLRWRDARRLDLAFSDLALERLGRASPLLEAWGVSGVAQGELALRPVSGGAEFDGRVRFDKGRFASADGLQAAEDVQLEYVGQGRWRDGRLAARGSLDWSGGEAYFHPVYLEAGAQAELDLEVDDRQVVINAARLALDGARSLEGRGRYDRLRRHWDHAAVSLLGGDLAVLGPRFIVPLVAPAQQARVVFDGMLSARIEIVDGALQAVDAELDAARFNHVAAELAVGPVSGSVPWRAAERTEARVRVEGMRWQALELGGFEALARVEGPRVDVDRLAVPVLDGRMVLQGLSLLRDARGWSGGGSAVVEPISMERLSEALGWPRMQGVFAASIPRLRVTPGELALEGALVASLFDGYAQFDGLRVLEPFGVASHMQADVRVRHIDLEQLTAAFEFGSITGFIDADIAGLELIRWRPVRFDADVRSSPGRYPRRISQRAVANIGALGGPGATLALQRGFLSFFDSFGYREIGVSCRLRGNVCELAGVAGADRADGGFVIVRGGGLPALNVIGYNRRVDWPVLVDRLMRVIESNTPPVIE